MRVKRIQYKNKENIVERSRKAEKSADKLLNERGENDDEGVQGYQVTAKDKKRSWIGVAVSKGYN